MGQFSWLDCISGKPIIDNKKKNAFLLVPDRFSSKYGSKILEEEYDGYGNFGKYDIYDLIAEWNKDMIPEIIRKAKIGLWKCSISVPEIKILENYYYGLPLDNEFPDNGPRIFLEKRRIGIIMACYDEDNARLDYPIKVTYSSSALYENCKPSLSDPNQGWGCD